MKEEELTDKNSREVLVNNEYSIRIPSYMDEDTSLNEAASLQYMNGLKETYIIIIDESKKEIISTFENLGEYDRNKPAATNYRNIQLKSLERLIHVTDKKILGSTKINGLQAELADITGMVDGINSSLTYKAAYVDGRKKLYLILAWTMSDRYNTYQRTFDQMIRSFKLVKKKKR